MRLAIISFLVFICGAVLSLPHLGVSWNLPPEYSSYPIFALLLLSMLLQFESIGNLKLKSEMINLQNKSQKDIEKPHNLKSSDSSKLEIAEKSLAESSEARDHLVKEVEILTSKNKSLLSELETKKTALKDKDLHYKDLEKSFAEKKDSQKETKDSLLLLSLFQENGRFLDFVMDDIAGYDDSQVGAAGRIVHQGCKKVLKNYFAINPLVDHKEGDNIKLSSLGKEGNIYRLVGASGQGNVDEGKLLHKGWESKVVNLPQKVYKSEDKLDINVIVPAEIEVS